MVYLRIRKASDITQRIPLEDENLAYEIAEDFHKGRFDTLTVEINGRERKFFGITDIRVVADRKVVLESGREVLL